MDAETLSLGKDLRRDLWNIWGSIHPKVKEKFKNVNGKTGRYNVPLELFQKRTSRENRVLLPWKTVYKNNLKLEHLKTFYGGVCVEFVNDDYLNPEYSSNKLFSYLKERVGSNEKISAIISFRTEDGDSGANKPRTSYAEFINHFGEDVLDKRFSPIVRDESVEYSGKGDNSVWKGNIYISIKGGSQTSIESHIALGEQKLFNPAVEYANAKVCLDIDIVMSYFALHCFDIENTTNINIENLLDNMETYLKNREYDEGNLFEYCTNHPTLKFGKNYLIDPIRLIKVSIENYKTLYTENSSDICHDESANKDKFYFDTKQKCVLSPARPTNLFWATHLSNMMQQNWTLKEYFREEEKRTILRKKLLSKQY